jgi:hypothetical protein
LNVEPLVDPSGTFRAVDVGAGGGAIRGVLGITARCGGFLGFAGIGGFGITFGAVALGAPIHALINGSGIA